MPHSVKIGHDVETGELVSLGDIERRSGLYILGVQGTGKSTLLVNLIDQDIKNGHGLFFLDPHGDAIDDLLDRCGDDRLLTDLLLLNPTDESHSFGINLLSCKNPGNLAEYTETYIRAYEPFKKIFANEFGSWGPWMQQALESTIYAFIENQGYTYADMLDFLEPDNKDFRDYIVSNISLNSVVAKFWKRRYSPVQAQALQTRLTTFLGHPYVKHIVGQQKTTVDFTEIMNQKRIVFLKLPANLSTDMKRFIGIVVISELVYAATKRPKDKRHQFNIVVDEFQNYAAFEDFATLFTQARKFGIGTIITHQERYGQLANNIQIQGATGTAGNKILFRLTSKDAQELAPEFAKEPPMETKQERELAVSQNPVSDLLRGHANMQINSFVSQYIRRIHERLEDTKEEMEGERLVRMVLLDEASLFRLDEQREMLALRAGRIGTKSGALNQAGSALQQAQNQTAKLISLHESSRRMRQTLRLLDHWFVDIMEGRLVPGQEQFSQFLISCVHDFSVVPQQYKPILELYISLTYGDPKALQVLPFEFAKRHGFFTQTITVIEQETEEKFNQVKEAFEKEQREEYRRRYRESDINGDLEPRICKAKCIESVRSDMAKWEHGFDITKYRQEMMFERYNWYIKNPLVQKALAPYNFAQFERLPGVIIPQIKDIDSTLAGNKFFFDFLQRLGEGAIVTLVLAESIVTPHWWCIGPEVYPKKVEIRHHFADSQCRTEIDYRQYPGLNMFCLPRIQGREPYEIFLLLASLAETIDKKEHFQWTLTNYRDDLKLLRIMLDQVHPLYKKEMMDSWAEILSGWWAKSYRIMDTYFQLRACDIVKYGQEIADRTFPLPSIPGIPCHRISFMVNWTAQHLRDAIQETEQKEEEEHFAFCEKELQENWIARYEGWRHERKVPSVPDYLPARVLSDTDREGIRNACQNEFKQGGWNADAVLAIINDFVQFCILLSKPENHIKIATGQYVEKEVNSRAFVDMGQEMARELTRLDSYIAYVMVLQGSAGTQTVLNRKIRTLPLPQLKKRTVPMKLLFSSDDFKGLKINHLSGLLPDLPLDFYVILQTHRLYCTERSKIEEELFQRQENWRGGSSDRPPSATS